MLSEKNLDSNTADNRRISHKTGSGMDYKEWSGKWSGDFSLINSLHTGLFFMLFCRLLIFFFKINFLKKIFQEYFDRTSNSLDPDQAQLFVGPDLGLNCCQGYQQSTQVDKE